MFLQDTPSLLQKDLTITENRMFWEAEEKKLDERVYQAPWPGGQKAVERLAKQGKKPVRDLIQQLIDPGSMFFELGQLAGFGVNYPGGIDDVPLWRCGHGPWKKSTATGP